MSVTRGEVDRIAGLARLELGGEEAESLRKDLNGILEHMETLAEAGIPGGGPMGPGSVPATESGNGDGSTAEEAKDGTETTEAHRTGPAPFREDGEAAPDALALPPEKLAPRWEEGFFSVPRLPGLEDEAAP